jgi:pimeloyl-ACP methyl ester carboxylesterase
MSPDLRPWLLLIPGLLCDDTVWAPQIRALSATHRCVVARHGRADSIERMAIQALELLPAGVAFDVAGHSMGGRCALELARQVPDRVRRLALLDTGFQARPAGVAGEAEATQRLALLTLAREQGMRAMGRVWARGMVHPGRLDSPLFESILDMIERASADQFAAQIRALLARPDAQSLLPAISAPTLILCGREDTWSPLARHEDMARHLRRATLAVIEQCGHMSTLEQPDAVTEAMRIWLAQPAEASPGH